MINLLPGRLKKDIQYGRRNTILARMAVWLSLVIVGVLGIGLSGLFYMNQSIRNVSSQVERTRQELAKQKIDETQKKVEDIGNNLKLTTQVLSREVLFSKLIKQIGAAMPSNTILTDLKIGKTEGGIDLTAIASDYNTATQVQVNLSDQANKIFDKADIINATCTPNPTDPKYPCTVNIRARFGKNNSFTFSGDKKL